MEDRSALTLVLSDSELDALQGAVLARIADLDSRKRLPRGLSLRDIRRTVAELERIATLVGRERGRRSALAMGEGLGEAFPIVEIGDRVPAALDLVAGDA